MQFFDTLTIDDSTPPRKTADGYLVADVRMARTGVQIYAAKDLGLTDRDPSAPVRVYRPPSAVFDAKAMASFAYRPVTNDHPPEAVTAQNWRDYSVGQIGGEVIRDGHFVKVPMILMDSAAIRDYEAGKRELSGGYTADVELRDGIVPAGEPDAGQPFDAVQSDIRGNHLALCDRARGGTELRIGDAGSPEQKPTEAPKGATPVKIMTVDGYPVSEVSAQAETVITKLLGDRQTAVADADALRVKLADAETLVQTHVGTITARDAEIETLKKQLADAASPAALEALVAARTATIETARRIMGDSGADFTGKTEAQIKRAALSKSLGDARVALLTTDAAIDGAFVAAAPVVTDAVREGVLNGQHQVQVGDAAAADAARREMIDSFKGGKTPTQGAA